jgi:hypothetical protein
MNSLNPELIRYSRKHAYQDAEGFNTAEIEFNLADLPAHYSDFFARQVIDLAEIACISYETAQGALLCWMIEQDFKRCGIEKGTK